MTLTLLLCVCLFVYIALYVFLIICASHTMYHVVLLESSRIFLRCVHDNYVLLILNKGFLCLLNKTITWQRWDGPVAT